MAETAEWRLTSRCSSEYNSAYSTITPCHIGCPPTATAPLVARWFSEILLWILHFLCSPSSFDHILYQLYSDMLWMHPDIIKNGFQRGVGWPLETWNLSFILQSDTKSGLLNKFHCRYFGSPSWVCHRFVQTENLGEKKPHRREQKDIKMMAPNESVSWGHKTATEEIQQLETQLQTKQLLLL